VWEELVTILWNKLTADGREAELSREQLRRALAADEALTDAFGGAWPIIDPADLVGDLWSVPAYLRRCAPWLTPDEVARLRRPDPLAWTRADLPLLDAARQRLGDPEASRHRRRQAAAHEAQREAMSGVVDRIIEAEIETDGSDLKVMGMLRGDDLRAALLGQGAVPAADPDVLAGPFAHIVVDEAQELTDAEWQMLLLRCPSRSFTVVGDRAQARHGFTESWPARLERVGLHGARLAALNINYRTPQEVMAEAEPVIRAALPDANVPTSVRSTGVPVTRGPLDDLDAVVDGWLSEHAEGTACVVGHPTYVASDRVSSLSPALTKGLEFDLVVLVDPETFGAGIEGAVDRYVAMTRATQRLVVLTSG
jgi:superfamily I DNA/RNA helicase